MQGSVIRSNYSVEKRLHTTFLGGSLPSWLSDESNGGGTISVESTNGGRATLSTGTSGTGDESKFWGPEMQIGPFDALLVRATVEFDQDAVVGPSETELTVGMQSMPSASNRLLHWMARDVGPSVVIEYGSQGDTVDTRSWLHADDPVTTALLWDAVDDLAIHRFQDSYAVHDSSQSISTSETYRTTTKIITRDTSADRIMHCYDFEIAYLSRKSA
jgi:hypothetical protein